MSRHAYCIIAHYDSYCLQTLINLIDDERNDIYILIDKKSDFQQFVDLRATKSKLIIPTPSVSISWGSLSLVKAELAIFKIAISQGRYDYLHLLSGQDLPLKTQNQIHDFFDALKEGTNMIGFVNDESNNHDLARKTNYHYFFLNKFCCPNSFVRKVFSCVRKSMLKLQKIVGYKRKYEMKLFKGSSWVSVTSDFASYLVEREAYILNTFKRIPCADEIYKQTMIMSSKYRGTVYDVTLENAGMTRKIDWGRGRPYIWRICDFDELIESTALFARKFSSSVDKDIIDRVARYLFGK